jgi:hypothetical protein
MTFFYFRQQFHTFMARPNRLKMCRPIWIASAMVILLALQACNAPLSTSGEAPPVQEPPLASEPLDQEASEDPEAEIQAPETSPKDATGPIDLGGAVLEEVVSIAEGDTAGPILTVRLSNPTAQEVEVTIPCGLIFQPGPDSDEQRLMVIQPASVTISAGETAELTPYVVCIDADRSVPGTGSAYVEGTVASGDLLKLAECICLETLATDEEDPVSFEEEIGVQFAVWSAAGGFSQETLAEDLEEAEGALGAFGELESMEGFEGLFDAINQLSTAMGGEWLDKCGIEIEAE